jgi:hypothetical protein
VSTDAQHAEQVRARLARGIMDPSQVQADLARLLDRAERAESERDERTRAAVVKALRWAQQYGDEEVIREQADAIENGAEVTLV